MSASGSRASDSRASPPLSEPRSPPAPSAPAKETRDGARGSSGVLACTSPSEAAGPPRKRLCSALPVVNHFAEAGEGAKPVRDLGVNAVVRDTALLDDDGQFELASAVLTSEREPESQLFSCQPLGAASDMVLGASGSAPGLQPTGLFKLDGAKHKIFLSHSGAQKDFVEQLCVDLERMGYLFPFFDERQHSLPKGEDFAPLILEAAQLCHVAVIVLSEEYLSSKWPMIELAEFYTAQQGARGCGHKLKLLPLFFKLSIEEVKDEGRWMPKWKEHAASDDRIDLSKWSAAVKALCKCNGLDFAKFAKKEVAYRKRVVESIFKLSPPNLLFGSYESMVGARQMCEVLSSQFVEDPTIRARVLGLYGMSGLGKTMLAKALCDYFCGEFLGKVCYVDMRRGSRARRQEWMLEMLCGFEESAVRRIGGDVGMGLVQLKTFMKRERVFLVLDNITYDAHLLQEAQDYLKTGFHLESQILITSSSRAILQDLLPNMESYMPMPRLMVEEAEALFLNRAAPMKAISELTSEEHAILGVCIEKCWFYSDDSMEGGSYHPVALTALADFFSRLGRGKGSPLLVWKDHLEKEMDLVMDVLKSSKDLFGLLGLQFSTFDFSEKLLFLDLALFQHSFGRIIVHTWNGSYYGVIGWLCRLHDESPTIIRRRLMNLQKSGMINLIPSWSMESQSWDSYKIHVPHLYQEFAKWYATDHNVNGLKNALGVFQPGGMNLRGDSSLPIKCWSNLVRLCISPLTFANSRLVASKKMQELRNLVVLHLCRCDNLTKLNLEGLDCLRELQLVELGSLVTVTLSWNSSKDKYRGIYDSLQHVVLMSLYSLRHIPDLRPCTSLRYVCIFNCREVTNLEGADCLSLQDLALYGMNEDHLEKIMDFKSLKSLKKLHLTVFSNTNTDFFSGEWVQRTDDGTGVCAALKGDGRCAKLLKKLLVPLYDSNNMICTWFVPEWKGECEESEFAKENDFDGDGLFV